MIKAQPIRYVDFNEFYDDILIRSKGMGYPDISVWYILYSLFYCDKTTLYSINVKLLSKCFDNYIQCPEEDKESCKKVFENIVCPFVKNLGFNDYITLSTTNRAYEF